MQLTVEPGATLCVFARDFDDALGVEHLFDHGSRVPEVVDVAVFKLVEEGVVMRQDQRLEVACLELLAGAGLKPSQQRSQARSRLSCQRQFRLQAGHLQRTDAHTSDLPPNASV